MKIKEVEESVGISANTIRFYEEMGLIYVKRNPESKYREFQEEDVKRLKEIKLFRGLGITMEEIRRFYNNEITLEEMMNHQVSELYAQNEDMQLKIKLCKEIKDSKMPLVSYNVKQYDYIMNHKSTKTPIEKAGSLISSWNRTQYTKKRIVFIESLLFPFIWMWVSFIILFLYNIPTILATNSFEIQYDYAPLIFTTILSLCISYYDYYFMIFPDELYEFHEKGIYYVRKSNRRSFFKIRKAVKQDKIEEYMDFLPYEELEIFKIWFHVCARAPLGANAYQLDFYIHSVYDEVIKINTGMIGVSNEKIKLTMEILKEKSKKMIDPFQIYAHIDLSNEDFYAYLNKVYQRREYQRVFGSNEKIKNKN